MQYRSTNLAGFTLMEVLVALVVLALVGITLVQTTQNTTSQSRYLSDKVIATWVAADRATNIRLALRTGTDVMLDDETVQQADRSWRTKVQVAKQTGLLDRVEVEVYTPEQAVSPIYTLTTYIPHMEPVP